MSTVTSPALAEVYAHGPGKDPKAGPPPARPGHARTPGVSLADLARCGPFTRAVTRTLRLALGPRRWEPWNIYQEHRAYPSARAAYLVDVAVLAGDAVWPLDPVRERLRHADETTAARALSGRTPVRLRLTVHPERMPAGYGPLAAALAWLEAGHVAGALAETAAALALSAGVTAPGDLRSAPEGTALEFTLAPGGGSGVGWARVTAHRSSGIGPRGLSCDPSPLPGEHLPALATAAAEPPPGSPAGWGGLRHTVAVRAVTGHPDGWYELRGGQLILRSPTSALDQVQAGFSYPRRDVDVAGMNLAWVVTADTPGAVRAAGAAGYHRLLLSAGALAQHVSTAAAAAGLFCRPARSVHEAPLEAAAAAPTDHDFLYLLLLGRSRVRDFAYHLTPPEVLP